MPTTQAPALTIRRSADRGRTRIDWLDSYHTFSFGDYFDPAHMAFRSLRVINDDIIAGGGGFGEHPHRDMEIITWVLDGALQHRDSLGHGAVIRPGRLQMMSAGKGIRHSEFNASQTEPVRLLQIWISPRARGLTPRYDQGDFDLASRTNRLCLVASGDGRDGSVRIEQDADVFVATLQPEATVSKAIDANRHVWVQVARGQVRVNGEVLDQGDAASLSGPATATIGSDEGGEVMVFVLP